MITEEIYIEDRDAFEVAIDERKKWVYLCKPGQTVAEAINDGSNVIRVGIDHGEVMVHHMGADMVTIVYKDSKNYDKLLKFGLRMWKKYGEE